MFATEKRCGAGEGERERKKDVSCGQVAAKRRKESDSLWFADLFC